MGKVAETLAEYLDSTYDYIFELDNSALAEKGMERFSTKSMERVIRRKAE